MKEDQLSKFQQFISKAVLADQTLLINSILLNGIGEKQGLCKMYDSTKNLVNVDENDGPVIQVNELIADINKKLGELEISIQQTEDEMELAKLADQIKQLKELRERASKLKVFKNYIFEWLLVPDWMADELINLGEVVYRCMGNTFWGISTLFKENHTKEDTLAGIFEELHKL